MITDTAKAIEATKQLVAVPFLGGSSSESDYREAMELVDYLIENDDENPLIDFLARVRLPTMKITALVSLEFNKAIAEIPVGVALLRTLIDQHKLSYSDLKDEIGSKSLVSQILSGQRSLTITHIKLFPRASV